MSPSKPHIAGGPPNQGRRLKRWAPKGPGSTTEGKIQDLKSAVLTFSSVFFLQRFSLPSLYPGFFKNMKYLYLGPGRCTV